MNAPLRDRYPVIFPLYPYSRSADQDAEIPARHSVVIVGGGPIGLAVALDLGQKGHAVVVLDDHEGVGTGSRAICFAKRTLEICHRLGAADRMLDHGVVWQKGRVFHAEDEIFNFDLLPEDGHRYPAFINLSQIHFEKYLHEAIERARTDGAQIDIRGKNRVDTITRHGDHVALEIMTPEGPYQITADWLVACDGARSPIREMMGLDFDGRVFEDNFLIADVKMTADFPTERWFWFEPPFKDAGQSALLHKQPDGIWRIDFQLGWDIDRDKELQPDRVRARVDAMLSSQTGEVPEYELEWTSIYTFQCRRMKEFRHGRVFFAGDSAHQVSPFGARGANSGLQDAENLTWKLDLVMRGLAGDALLDSYATERAYGADENILNSSRATDFMTPKTEISQIFRNAVLDMAARHPFGRPLVNSGRLSVPCIYDEHVQFCADGLAGPAVTRPGAPCADAPFGNGFLLDQLGGDFVILALGGAAPAAPETEVPVRVLHLANPTPEMTARYLGSQPSAVYLIRPDQHVVGRWPAADQDTLRAALRRALAQE